MSFCQPWKFGVSRDDNSSWSIWYIACMVFGGPLLINNFSLYSVSFMLVFYKNYPILAKNNKTNIKKYLYLNKEKL